MSLKVAVPVAVAAVFIAAVLGVLLLQSSDSDEKEPPESVIDVNDKDATVDQGVRFDGGQSGGDVVSYRWDFGDGTTSNEESPTHTYDEPGTYIVNLTVSDDQGNEDTTSVTIRVNSPPRAAFSVSDTTPTVYKSLTFDATESSDDDGTIEEYYWEFGDGGTGESETVQHAYNDVGEYTVRLRVKDSDGAEDTAELELDVTLRTFRLTWKVENETVTIQNTSQEYGNPNNVTISQTDRDNLVYVSFHLTWDDRTPVNVVSEGNDNFTLTVWPPGSSARNESSEYESILFEWDLAEVPDELDIPAKTEADAWDSVDADEYESEEGRGIWEAMVYLGEAGDGLLREDGGIYPDTSNSWTLEVTYHYYVMVINEVES